jgi:hypothetical protein
MENARAEIETSNYELEPVQKSNEIRYLLVYVTSRRDAENNIVSSGGTGRDRSCSADRAVAAIWTTS